jgi:hypothetical protein
LSPTPPIEVLGIRHHGPGSARSVRRALEQLRPSHVVIEGPPEFDDVVHHAAAATMVPPVAGLVYAVDEPRRASFYPLADFSPEWVAIRWAHANGARISFADLPATHHLADEREVDSLVAAGDDPITRLAQLAGDDDPEAWWEDAIEHRGEADDALARFAAVTDAMASMREGGIETDTTLLREAWMRKVIRALVKDAGAGIAVVCGAHHAPVLVPEAWPSQKSDAELTRNLAKVKVAATWSPWTSRRLAFASGYGAGVTSPGWYHHVFTTGEDVVARWMVRAATLLRSEQYHVSPASAVEATRLADALAALRARPHAGLPEVIEAIRAAMCDGSDLPLALVHDRLVVGDALGTVPDETPQVPIARDLAARQKRLRLAPSAVQKTVTLDLRQDSGLARSVLLHRLALLDVHWGVPADTGRTTGTFKESWLLEWQPRFTVDLVVASVYGTTIESAATAKVAADAAGATDLRALAALVEACLLADLHVALRGVLDALAERTAQQHDAVLLLDAVEPLARTFRYGDVRGADRTAIGRVLEVLVMRATVGLANAVASLDDERAEVVRDAIEAAHRGVALVDVADLRDHWQRALVGVSEQPGVHGSVQGRVVRLLLDASVVAVADVRAQLGRNLSRASDARHGAAWLDGFLVGDVTLLLHDPELMSVIDEWVAAVPEETFDDVLPLVRRAFSRFEKAERRMLGERLRRGADARPVDAEIDVERAAPAVARVAALLGLAS